MALSRAKQAKSKELYTKISNKDGETCFVFCFKTRLPALNKKIKTLYCVQKNKIMPKFARKRKSALF